MDLTINGEKPDSAIFDRDAFERLFFEHYKPLVAYAFGIINERQSAEDVVQDVFTSVWFRRGKIDLVYIRAYLYKSVYHKSLSFLETRKNQQEMGHPDIIEDYLASFVSRHDQSDDLFAKDLMQEIDRLIESLPEQNRRVFKLSRESNLSNKEIASLLEISEKAVEKHITKALSALRSRLKETGLLLWTLICHL
ncbi:RNA polymerase sigma-70 factor [Parabacteroides faecis]|uniref:RNA polymerase sigma-70 factor n=1 Tax=Parabacteroides faecis TaxID=1217282 RepID=UPI002164EF4D|nr:RNA polymerase sigma-70 factor [Parabacteroides faecis]MCS2891879.1 RNA polymerase sigma-70 factor [Parabacteroides faecis]UVQ44516.1 RNA polymerase sigma-70 factor [Parabacteroides faecis]